MEIRSIGGVLAQGRKVTGYVAVFNSETDLGEFRERIAPGAFRSTLAAGRNIRALYDHQTGAVLGTTQARTLELREDDKGLAFSLELPDTTVGRDVAELVRRGDVSGCSFGFRVNQGGDKWEIRSGVSIRTLTDVILAEVTLTADPAYADTELALRSMGFCDAYRDNRALWLDTVR